jgi:hypothetical protein
MRPTSPAPSDPSAAGAQDSRWARPAEQGDAPSTPIQPDQTPTQPVPTGQIDAGPAVTPVAQPVAYEAQSARPGQPVGPAPKRRSSGRWLNGVLAIAAAVAIAGVAFAVGRGTASASTAAGQNRTGAITNGNGNGNGRPFGSFAPGGNGGAGFRGGFGGGAAGLTITGTVESLDGDTITIKTTNGQSVTLNTGSDTTYHTQAPANASDVTTGKTVQVQVGLAGGFGGRGGGNGNGGGNGGGTNGPTASGAPAGPIGTADSITVVP